MADHTEGLMTSAEARSYLKVSRSKFVRMENEGKIQRVELGPKTIRYRKQDLDALIEASMRTDAESGASET